MRAVYADATRTSRYLALAKDGLWFTDWVPSSGAGPRIGRLPLSGTGAPRWMVRGVRAWFMATGPDGRPWVGLARGKVARISTSGALTRLSLPRRYDGSEMTSSGGYVWYGAVQPFNAPDPGRSVIVRIRP